MATNAKNLAELLNTDTTVAVGDIADGSVTTAKLAADAVSTAKLADAITVVTANVTDDAIQVENNWCLVVEILSSMVLSRMAKRHKWNS